MPYRRFIVITANLQKFVKTGFLNYFRVKISLIQHIIIEDIWE